MVETNGDCAPFGIHLPMPIFRWFEAKDPKTGAILDANWNQQLCVVARKRWGSLHRFLSSIAGKNNDTKTFCTLASQKIPVVDAFAFANLSSLPAKIPTVDCFAFAMLSNRRSVYFAPEQRVNPWDPVPVLYRNADPKVAKYAKAIFRGVAAPMAGTTEPTLSEAQAQVSAAGDSSEKLMRVVRRPTKLPITDAEMVERYLRGEVKALGLSEGANTAVVKPPQGS
jgi:hypothetical protein